MLRAHLFLFKNKYVYKFNINNIPRLLSPGTFSGVSESVLKLLKIDALWASTFIMFEFVPGDAIKMNYD